MSRYSGFAVGRCRVGCRKRQSYEIIGMNYCNYLLANGAGFGQSGFRLATMLNGILHGSGVDARGHANLTIQTWSGHFVSAGKLWEALGRMEGRMGEWCARDVGSLQDM